MAHGGRRVQRLGHAIQPGAQCQRQHQGARERRSGEKFGAGNLQHPAALHAFAHGLKPHAHLAGVDHHVDALRRQRHQLVDSGAAGRHQPGFGRPQHMGQHALATRQRGGAGLHKVGVHGFVAAHPAGGVAHRNFGHLDAALGPGTGALRHLQTGRRVVVKVAALGRQRHAAAGFLRRDQDIGERHLGVSGQRQHHRDQLGVGAGGGQVQVGAVFIEPHQQAKLAPGGVGQAAQPEAGVTARCFVDGLQQLTAQTFGVQKAVVADGGRGG